jgi:hypothetical protein
MALKNKFYNEKVLQNNFELKIEIQKNGIIKKIY